MGLLERRAPTRRRRLQLQLPVQTRLGLDPARLPSDADFGRDLDLAPFCSQDGPKHRERRANGGKMDLQRRQAARCSGKPGWVEPKTAIPGLLDDKDHAQDCAQDGPVMLVSVDTVEGRNRNGGTESQAQKGLADRVWSSSACQA